MTLDEVRQKFATINTWKRGNQRAPHKPLLLLYALGWYSAGKPRMIPYEQIDPALNQLLRDFGPFRKSYHPEYPFWRLQHDNLWELANAEKVQASKSNADAKKSELLKYEVTGGLPEEIFTFLHKSPEATSILASDIFNAHFSDTLFDEILQAVGLMSSKVAYDLIIRKRRNSKFRNEVLEVYQNRCAVCGFDVKMGDKGLGLEAAHIQWHSHQGPDSIQNGIALCSLHHKLFDVGAWYSTRRFLNYGPALFQARSKVM